MRSLPWGSTAGQLQNWGSNLGLISPKLPTFPLHRATPPLARRPLIAGVHGFWEARQEVFLKIGDCESMETEAYARAGLSRDHPGAPGEAGPSPTSPQRMPRESSFICILLGTPSMQQLSWKVVTCTLYPSYPRGNHMNHSPRAATDLLGHLGKPVIL